MKGYDYSLEGAYFVTIATSQRVCLFGTVDTGKIVLNTYGKIAFEQWVQLKQRFLPCEFPKFIIMPNHVHGIIQIVRGAGEVSQLASSEGPPLRSKIGPTGAPLRLSAYCSWFIRGYHTYL